jgi:hypothetical protein
MRGVYQDWEIRQTPSAIFQARVKGSIFTAHQGPEKAQRVSALSSLPQISLLGAFPHSWSHYSRLLAVHDIDARAFYEVEAIRGGWCRAGRRDHPPNFRLRRLRHPRHPFMWSRLSGSLRKRPWVSTRLVPLPRGWKSRVAWVLVQPGLSGSRAQVKLRVRGSSNLQY